MRVLLNENLPNLGNVGDVVKVKDGYARNYLIPRSLAVLANEAHRAEFEHKKRVLEKKKAIILADKKSVAKKIEKLKFSIAKQVGEEDRIFGSVTTAEIAALLESESVVVDRRTISFPEEIKKVGEYKVDITLHPEVTAKLKIAVVKHD